MRVRQAINACSYIFRQAVSVSTLTPPMIFPRHSCLSFVYPVNFGFNWHGESRRGGSKVTRARGIFSPPTFRNELLIGKSHPKQVNASVGADELGELLEESTDLSDASRSVLSRIWQIKSPQLMSSHKARNIPLPLSNTCPVVPSTASQQNT